MMLSPIIMTAIFAFVLLARFSGVGRDWWPRDPFS